MSLYMIVFDMMDGDRSNETVMSVKRISDEYRRIREGCFLFYKKERIPIEEIYERFSLEGMNREEKIIVFDLSNVGITGFADDDTMEWLKEIIMRE